MVAEELARRFGLPLWRFANSGTESTMDAVHLMRAVTGRSKIVKVEGSVPRPPRLGAGLGLPRRMDELGPSDHPASVPASTASRRRSPT